MAKKGSFEATHHYPPFETVVREMALISATQLHDAFRTQRIFDGSNNRSHEVWHRQKWVTEEGTPDAKGRKRRGKRRKIDWGWFDENALRKKKKQENPSVDYWFSTGASRDETRVEVSNLKADPNHLLIEGEVRYRTTMQMYYVETGVGANGRNEVRGRRGIKVDRDDPFSWRYRYVNDWVPHLGHTHRPSVRQQVYYMTKRMKWLAKKEFGFMLNTWLQISLTEMLDTGDNTVKLPFGLGLSIKPSVE